MKDITVNKITVLIVDDHTIVRDGISALLALSGDIEVIGEASNGNEAIQKVRELNPDVVLMDVSMPILGGLESTRRICKESRTKVIILTQYDDKEYVFPALEAGASGFISKVAASAELATAIRSVYNGDSYLSPPIAKLIVEDYRTGDKRGNTDPYQQLTARERDVIKLIAEGYTTQQIADMLVVSPKTVEGHRTNLMAKLGLRNRVELVKYAVRKGIISI